MKNNMLKISSKSNTNSVAGAITALFKEEHYEEVELLAVGAAALNQAIKAIATARGYIAPYGYNLICIPAFCEIELDDSEKTGIKLILKNNR